MNVDITNSLLWILGLLYRKDYMLGTLNLIKSPWLVVICPKDRNLTLLSCKIDITLNHTLNIYIYAHTYVDTLNFGQGSFILQ